MAGFNKGNFHNHSLRATSCSRMFDKNVDEQIICEVSGHCSNAVCRYKKTDNLRRQISSVLQGHDVCQNKSKESVKAEGSGLSDIEIPDKVLVTPGKCKIEVVSQSTHADGICEFIKNVTSQCKYKKIKHGIHGF